MLIDAKACNRTLDVNNDSDVNKSLCMHASLDQNCQ